MRLIVACVALCAVASARADKLATLQAQNAMRPHDADDVTLGDVVRGGEIRRMAPPRTSPGKLVRDKDGNLTWHTPDGTVVSAKLAAMARDPSSIAAARADLETAVLESAGVARADEKTRAKALADAAKEARKDSKGRDAAAGAGLLALGAVLGRASRRA